MQQRERLRVVSTKATRTVLQAATTKTTKQYRLAGPYVCHSSDLSSKFRGSACLSIVRWQDRVQGEKDRERTCEKSLLQQVNLGSDQPSSHSHLRPLSGSSCLLLGSAVSNRGHHAVHARGCGCAIANRSPDLLTSKLDLQSSDGTP